MKVIIDNGHGIDTVGKRSPVWPDGSQLFEYEFNRDIANRLSSVLDAEGIENVLVVPETIDIPLIERVNRINYYHKNMPGSFLVSIHANAGGGSGWEVFTSKGETKSDQLAEYFATYAEITLPGFRIRKDTTDGDSDKEADFYILKNTRCPAVLTENLFMDTERDCKFLMTEKGRQAIVDLHVGAIVHIVKNKILQP